jgi:hypothetical protein
MLTVGYSLWNNFAVATDWLLAINKKLPPVRLKSRQSGRTARCAQSSCATIRFSTLFLPQLSSNGGRSHPLIVAFLSATAELTKP